MQNIKRAAEFLNMFGMRRTRNGSARSSENTGSAQKKFNIRKQRSVIVRTERNFWREAESTLKKIEKLYDNE